MKKFFAFLLTAAMLVSMFAVVAPAADISYSITGVDVPVEEGGVVICTSLDNWANSNPNWSMNVQLTPNGDGYDVSWDSSCPIEAAAKEADQLNDDGTVKEGYVPSADELKDASGFSKGEDNLYVIIHGRYEVGYGMTATIDNPEVGGTITFSGAKGSAPVQKKVRVDNNIAKGKSYETSLPYRQGGAEVQWAYDENAAIAYPDMGGKELTDGYVQDNTAYDNGALVGLHYQTPDAAEKGYAWVKVDLGKEYDIAEARLYMPVEADGGIGISDVTFVGYKADGTEVALGENVSKDNAKTFSDSCVYASVEIPATVRYVEARLYRGGWNMVSEIVVIEAVKEDDNTGDDNTGDDNTGNEGDNNTEDDNKVDIDSIMGEANADAKFDVDIVAPEKYVPGETFSVDFVIKNIAVESGIDTVEFIINYDTTKLELAEELSGSAINVFNGFAEWEGLCVVNEDGTIGINAGTAGGDNGDVFTYAKADGEISFTIDFAAKADATGDALIYVANNSPMAYFTDDNGEYAGNGDYAFVAEGKAASEDGKDDNDSTADEGTDDESSNDEPTDDEKEPEAGDASSMIFFAIIALVAIAGSAVVVKTRK